MPGVLDILTARKHGRVETGEVRQAASSTSIQKLGPEILHDGQIIAVVVADTFEAAQRGRLQREGRPTPSEPPTATFGSPGVTEEDATKVSKQHKHLPQAGDAEAAIAGAEVTIDAEYETPTQHHNPIELFSTTCAWTRRQADGLRAKPVRLRAQERRRAAARHRAGEGARRQPLCRRRIRLEGQR